VDDDYVTLQFRQASQLLLPQLRLRLKASISPRDTSQTSGLIGDDES
jgi:hypothetical protein